MNIDIAAFEKIITLIPDEERLPLVIESEDWENLITPALGAWGAAFQSGLLSQTLMFGTLRYIIEVSYVMGYRRGQNDRI